MISPALISRLQLELPDNKVETIDGWKTLLIDGEVISLDSLNKEAVEKFNIVAEGLQNDLVNGIINLISVIDHPQDDTPEVEPSDEKSEEK